MRTDRGRVCAALVHPDSHFRNCRGRGLQRRGQNAEAGEPRLCGARPTPMRETALLPRAISVTCFLTLALTACADPGSTGETAQTRSASTGTEASKVPSGGPTTSPSVDDTQAPEFDRPPPVTVRYGTESVELAAYSFCYGTVCADGIPPTDPPDVGNPDHVVIDFPLDGWMFQATFKPAGETCGRMQTVPLERTAQGSFVLRPAGPAATYDVTLFGRGDGDLATVFRWTTPSAGPLPMPKSRLALLAGHDGQIDSYGVELEVSNLAKTPADVTATITTTASNGRSLTFEATRARQRCQPQGTVYWDGPDDQGTVATGLGPPPFTYDVSLDLDGTRHVAVARWPADVIGGNEPSVALKFIPALPALE